MVTVEPLKERPKREATADIKGLLTLFLAKSELKGLKEKTIQCRLNILKLLVDRGANLQDPENTFRTIDSVKRYDHKLKQVTSESWSNGSKNNAAQAYRSFCEINQIPIPEHINFDKWSQQPRKIPWIPLEREIDALIAGCSRRIATFLQLLKETGMRCGEAWRLKWIDIDLDHGIVTVNETEKQGIPHQCKISSKLIAMLNTLPKRSEKIFGNSLLSTLRKTFMNQRKRLAFKLQNPRFNQISFHTLRYFYGTMEYHRTKDLIHVQQKLGHRDIKSTLIYTQLVNFESDEYNTAISKSLEKDEELLKCGFSYVTERNGIKIYRKRK